jgi:hypothetical protein
MDPGNEGTNSDTDFKEYSRHGFGEGDRSRPWPRRYR